MGLIRTPPRKLNQSITPEPTRTITTTTEREQELEQEQEQQEQEQQELEQQELEQESPKQLNHLFNSIAPSPSPPPPPPPSEQQQTISQELDPFKKQPKLIRSPPNQRQQQQQQQQPSSIPVLTRQPKTPKINNKKPPLPSQPNPKDQLRREEQPEEAIDQGYDQVEHEQAGRIKPCQEHPTTQQTTTLSTHIPSPAQTLQRSTVLPTQNQTEPSVLTKKTTTIQLPISKNDQTIQPLPPPPQAPPKQTSTKTPQLNQTVKPLNQPIEQQKVIQLTAPVITQTQTIVPAHISSTSRKSFATDYDTSRESNATSLISNLQFMEHRIEELQELVKILEEERDLSELARQVKESERAWTQEWDGSRGKEIGRLKLEERILSLESNLKARELQFELKSLELKQLDNQLSIKDQQSYQLAEIINEHQRHTVSRYQGLLVELQQLRITNAEWQQIGQNFESLIEIERREKEELQGQYELELRQSQLEPNFEINTLKYQLVKAENRAERLGEQLQEIADQSKNFQTQLISESALKDKISRELELAEIRVRSLSDQVSDLNNTLSQIQKGEESNQRSLLHDLLTTRSALAEKEQEIISLNAHLGLVSQSSRPAAKRGHKKAEGTNHLEDEEDEEEAEAAEVDDPVRLITSDSWVSIGGVAKKLSRGRKGVNTSSKTESTTRDTGIGSSSKKGANDQDPHVLNETRQKLKKTNPKKGNTKQLTFTSTENPEPSDQSVHESDGPIISPETVRVQPPKKKNAKGKNKTKSSLKEKAQQISEISNDHNEPAIQPPAHEQPEENPEQPTNTRPKKRVGKGKAKQLTPDDEEPGPLEATDLQEPSVENNADQQSMKNSRPVRNKAAKKTAKAFAVKNNDDGEQQEKESDDQAHVVIKRGAKKPTAAVPPGRRKPGRPMGALVEKDAADESDLIVVTNEMDDEGAEDHGDSAIQAIADQDNDDDNAHEESRVVEAEEDEIAREVVKQPGKKLQKSAGPGLKKGKRAAAVPAGSPFPSPSVGTPPSPSPASGKKNHKVVLEEDDMMGSNAQKLLPPNNTQTGATKTKKVGEKAGKKKAVSTKIAKSRPPAAKRDKEVDVNEEDRREDRQAPPDPSLHPSEASHTKQGKKRKSNDQAATLDPGSPLPELSENDDRAAVEETLNKKKRKIFHSKKPALTWANNRDDENNMLGLPPELSPIKKPTGAMNNANSRQKRSSNKSNNILPPSLLK